MNFFRNMSAVIGALVLTVIIVAVGLAFSIFSSILSILFIPVVIFFFCWLFIDQWTEEKKRDNNNKPR